MSDKWKHDNWHNHQANRQKCGKEEIENCPYCRISELKEALKAERDECNEQARLLGISAEKELKRLTRISELEARLEKPFICIRCQRKALRGIGKTGGEG